MSQERIVQIKEEGEQALQFITTMAELEVWETKYFGRKSEFNAILKGLKNLTPEEKKMIGPLANKTKQDLFEAFVNAREALFEKNVDFEKERIDITAPGTSVASGHLHPITLAEQEIADIFSTMGFVIADGPEVDTERYNCSRGSSSTRYARYFLACHAEIR